MMTFIERLEFDRVISLIAERAGTKRGRELIEKLFPLKDRTEIEKRYAFIGEGVELENPPFYNESNLSGIISTIEYNELISPKELLEVADFLEFLSRLKRYFTDRKNCLYLSSIITLVSTLTDERQRIRSVIRKDGEIETEEILALKDKLRNLKQNIRDKLGKGVTLRGERYVRPIRSGQKINGIIHDISRGGKTLFVEPANCISLNNEIEITTRRIEEEKKRILIQLTNNLRDKLTDIETNIDIVSKYDFIIAISRISREKGWQIPQVGGEVLEIIKGRHPLLELRRNVVPLGVEVGTNFTTLLVTGPNMGGKTVALKTIGILSLMTMSGIPVPASPDSIFPVFDRIFCDIGDESSIESGDSSFSFHLKELKKMFDYATNKSLLLADEIDRGTEPDGGRAVASAFLEEFTRRKAITIASSHSTALKFFVAEGKGMQNARMKTKEGIPIYNLLIGLPGESLWLETASSVGIDGRILKRAEELADKNMIKIESLLRELEEEKGRISDIKKRLSEGNEAVRNSLSGAEYLKKKTGEELKKIKKEKKKILIKARKDIENLVREIRESNAAKKSIVRAKSEIEKRLKQETETKRKQIEKTRKYQDFNIGDRVKIASIDSDGKVVGLTQKKVTVLVDNVRFEMPYESLERIRKPHELKTESHHQIRFRRSREFKYEINLRNLRADEAIQKLEKYIDDVWLLGDGNFRIIHGVGRGILKKVIWEFLSNDNRVGSFELADLKDGGDGVTVGKIRV